MVPNTPLPVYSYVLREHDPLSLVKYYFLVETMIVIKFGLLSPAW